MSPQSPSSRHTILNSTSSPRSPSNRHKQALYRYRPWSPSNRHTILGKPYNCLGTRVPEVLAIGTRFPIPEVLAISTTLIFITYIFTALVFTTLVFILFARGHRIDPESRQATLWTTSWNESGVSTLLSSAFSVSTTERDWLTEQGATRQC